MTIIPATIIKPHDAFTRPFTIKKFPFIIPAVSTEVSIFNKAVLYSSIMVMLIAFTAVLMKINNAFKRGVITSFHIAHDPRVTDMMIEVIVHDEVVKP